MLGVGVVLSALTVRASQRRYVETHSLAARFRKLVHENLYLGIRQRLRVRMANEQRHLAFVLLPWQDRPVGRE